MTSVPSKRWRAFADPRGHDAAMGVGRLLFVASLFVATSARAETYYVATDGNDSGDGMSVASAWRTISHAAQQAGAGDTVYIKAGDYGAETVVFPTDGDAQAVIQFVGYRNTPGDDPDLAWSYPDKTELDATVMPLLDGNDRSQGTGLSLDSRSYVTVRNIQVRNYRHGVSGYNAHFVTVDNVITSTLGDVNAAYSGKGITFGSLASDCTLRNSVVYNAGPSQHERPLDEAAARQPVR